MTDIDWHAEAAKAQAAIAKDGAPTTITGPSIGQSGYDPDTDTYHAVSERSVEAFAVLATETITDDNGRLTRAQIATLTAPAMTGDTVTIGELQYRVAKSLTIAPGGVPLLWSAILET